MGFSLRALLFWLVAIAGADFLASWLKFSPQQQSLLNFAVVVGFVSLLLLFSRVARHNLRQLLHRDAHQWVGNGHRCEACIPPVEVQLEIQFDAPIHESI